MSIEVIKEQIQRFLETENPEVMAIIGKWGVGKTYFWNETLKTKREQVKLNQYSYVSLFGINSLSEFKISVIGNLTSTENLGNNQQKNEIGQKLKRTLNSDWKNIFTNLKEIPKLKDFFPSNLESYIFSSISKAIICIDDLDRAGKSLCKRDLLGLASFLKEQNNCKVCFLLNDEQKEMEEYKDNKEKVIDIEVRFKLTPKEAGSIIFKSDKDEITLSKRLSEKLGVINIRALKKIEYFVGLITPLLADYESEVKEQAIQSLILFTWCYYCSGNEVPTLEFVSQISFDDYLGFREKDSKTLQNERWLHLLSEYGFTSFDDFDQIIYEAVQSGFFEKEKFMEIASLKNEEILAGKGERAFRDAWKIFHESFDNNLNETVDHIYKAFIDNCKYIGATGLNTTVKIFRSLDKASKAIELIEVFINTHKGDNKWFNLEDCRMMGETLDQELVAKFEKHLDENRGAYNIRQILTNIIENNSRDPEDEVVLSNTTEDEFYCLFKSEKGPQLSSYIYTCLRFPDHKTPTDPGQTVSEKAKKALRRIALESKLNELRVKKYGIKLNKHDD